MKHPSNWVPSRFHLATFRLIGALYLLGHRPKVDRSPVFLSFERGQGQPELAIGSAAWLTSLSLFIAAGIQHMAELSEPWVPLLFLFSVPLSFAAIMVSMGIAGAVISLMRKARLIRTPLNAPLQERWHFIVMLGLSIASQGWTSWARCVGAFWLAATIVNGFAAIILWMMKSKVIEVEQRFGATLAGQAPIR